MFNGHLFKTQIPAAEKLCNKRRFLLAWEQGTGKTVISLAACEKLFELGKATNVLILVPTSLGWQWIDKIEEFTDTPYQFAEAKKPGTRRYVSLEVPNYWVVPYSLVRKDYDLISKQKWDVIIADEAQEFKSVKAKISKLVKKLNAEVKPSYRWALTGTSISNKLEELYSIFYWIDPKFLPPWPIFDKTHIVRDDFGSIESYKNLQSLHKYLQARIDRKTHADQQGNIPKILPQVHTIEPTKDYIKAQERLLGLLDKMVHNLHFDTEGNIANVRRDSKVSKAFSEVRQLLPALKIHYTVELCRRILEENPENKIVLFSFYKDPLYKLHEQFGSESVLYTGDQKTSDEKRHNANLFSGVHGPRILLASNAGAAGLDLPSANYVIHLDIPFSYGILDQRTKRITRMSSKFSHVVAIYLIVSDSFESYYYQLVKNKERLARATTEGGEDEVIIRPSSLRSFIRGDDDVVRNDAEEDRRVLQPEASTKVNRRKTPKAKQGNKGRALK